MSIFKKLSKFVLPKEVDFFGNLGRQSSLTKDVIGLLHSIYIEKSHTIEHLDRAMAGANQQRMHNLLALNQVLITPVDREAISRVYLSLDWIVLSVKHFNAEVIAFNITHLTTCGTLFILLKKQMEILTNSFNLLKDKKYDNVLLELTKVIALDDDLIGEYSHQLEILVDNNSVKYIITQREILSQLKEISKHIHICANTVEDIVFKMN